MEQLGSQHWIHWDLGDWNEGRRVPHSSLPNFTSALPQQSSRHLCPARGRVIIWNVPPVASPGWVLNNNSYLSSASTFQKVRQ